MSILNEGIPLHIQRFISFGFEVERANQYTYYYNSINKTWNLKSDKKAVEIDGALINSNSKNKYHLDFSNVVTINCGLIIKNCIIDSNYNISKIDGDLVLENCEILIPKKLIRATTGKTIIINCDNISSFNDINKIEEIIASKAFIENKDNKEAFFNSHVFENESNRFDTDCVVNKKFSSIFGLIYLNQIGGMTDQKLKVNYRGYETEVNNFIQYLEFSNPIQKNEDFVKRLLKSYEQVSMNDFRLNLERK